MTNAPLPPPDPRSAAPSPAPVPADRPRPSTASSSGSPLVLVVVGLVATAMILFAAALPVLRGDDGGEPAAAAPTSPDGAAPSTALELRPAPATTGEPEPPAPEMTAPPETVASTTPVSTEPTPAPPETVASTTPVSTEPTPAPPSSTPVEPADEVPESKAVVRGGQIFLEGAVPTAEAGEEIAALAAEILGPDNVFNNYVVDPRASDPNLGNVTVEDTINFATGSAVILPEAEGLLNQALALMTIRPSVTVIVVGHTDSRGTDEYNQALSEQRALAVKSWLTDRGIDGSRLTVVGKGESEPIASNDTPDGQRLNRRIQFFLENLLADS